MSNFYETIEEASTASIKLGIISGNDYRYKYKQDPKLPAKVRRFYGGDIFDSFGGWDKFLNKITFYKTIEEASKATIKLGIVLSDDYKVRRKEDSMLPSNPSNHYGKKTYDNFGGWIAYTGQEHTSKYETIEEASIASINLGIINGEDYRDKCKQDPKLPVDARKFYGRDIFDSFGGWDKFLNKITYYKTIEEASEATIKLGIVLADDYKVRQREDLRLPSNPSKHYGKKIYEKFGGWSAYTGQGVKLLPFHKAKEHIKKIQTIKTISNYVSYRKRHPEDGLPSRPYVSYSTSWKGWFDYLGVPEEPIYKSLKEALIACNKLDITLAREFGLKCHLDPKLPTSLPMYYHKEWKTWNSHFELINPYSSWEEAHEAVKRINLNTKSEYKSKTGYKQDKKLVWNPDVIYKDVWVNNGGWDGFLGKLMGSITASNFIKLKGVHDLNSYKNLQKETNFLPEDPIVQYDLVDFNEFNNLKVYQLSDVKNYCKRNKIRTLSEYNVACGKHEHLPQTKSIDGYVTINSIIDVDSCQFRTLPESYSEWIVLAKKYSNTGRNISRKEALVRLFIQGYLIKNNQPPEPGKFFLKSHNSVDMEDFFDNVAPSDKSISAINILREFIDYVFKECCQDEDPDTFEISTIPGFINKWNAIYCLEDEDLTKTNTLSQSDKPPLPMNYLNDAADFLIPPDATSFSDIHHFDSDWYEVDESIIDKESPDCVWRRVEFMQGRKQKVKYEMWSPVRTCGLTVMLRMPFRGQQVCWLDSGEADEEIPILNDKNEVEWIKNENQLLNSLNKHENPQGFVKRFKSQKEMYIDDEGKEAYRYIDIVGSHVTTNKTSHSLGGYDVAYMHPSLIKWMIKLREWQTKYNPISELTVWSDVSMVKKKNANVLKIMKSQAFLFRDPAVLELEKRSLPMTRNKLTNPFAWLLYQIQDPNNPLAELVEGKNKSGINRYVSEFTPHAMRVSMITAYILDGELPVSIVAKLVGHASLVMTIYYTKTDNHDLYESLSIADHKILANAPARIADMLKNKQISLSSSEFIGPDGSTIPQHYQNLPFAALAFKDFGICPYAGAKCDEGGEYIEGTNRNNKHGPVRSGYLGPSNCFDCRFFLTGPAFLGGLKTIFDEVGLEGKLCSKRVDKYRIEVETLEDIKYELDESGGIFEDDAKLNKLRNLEQQESEKLSALALDAIVIGVYAARSERLLSTSKVTKDSFQLITSEHNDFFKVEIEEASEFRQLYEICKNAEIYTCANPQRALPKRSLLIDKFAAMNGLKPSMCLLSEEEQLEVGNQITNIVLTRLNGNWNDADKLFNGELFLKDLGISSAEIMKPIEDKNKFIMNKSNLIKVSNVE